MEYTDACSVLWAIKDRAEQEADRLDQNIQLQLYFTQRNKIREYLKAVDNYRAAAKQLHDLVNNA